MNKKQFEKFLKRDRHCYHCGITNDTLVIQHRIGRGMGGKNSKANQVSNQIVLCSEFNGLMESDPDAQQLAYLRGYKLSQWQDTLVEPVFDISENVWYRLDNQFNRSVIAFD